MAIAQGHELRDRLFGGDNKRSWSFTPIPTAVFSVPPLATCGLTEAEAALLGPADIYLAQFTPLRHMMSGRKRKTTIKLVVDQASQRILGAHMLGDDAARNDVRRSGWQWLPVRRSGISIGRLAYIRRARRSG